MANPYVSITAPAGGYESQLANIVRRQKLAELLAQQGGEDIKVEDVGGIPTPISPFQGLAKVLQSGVGAYLGSKADEDAAALEESQNKGIAAVFEGMKDTPDVKTEGYYLPAEQPSKTMPIGMPRGASSFMPEGEATNMGTYVPGTVTPGQHLSRSERTNRIMAGLARYPKMAALAPMYVQNMQNEVEDQRYQAGLDRAEAARALEATRYATEQTQKKAHDAEELRRYEKTLAATNAGRSPGAPKNYTITGQDGKPVQKFLYPAEAKSLADAGNQVSESLATKRVPATLIPTIGANFSAIKKIDASIDELTKNPAAVGLMRSGPNWFNQIVNPSGTTARAIIADIGSLKLHDRSGAAVNASESPRLMPFIPQVSDPFDAAVKKLRQFRNEYDAIVADQATSYSDEEGYVPPAILTKAQQYIGDRNRREALLAKQNTK